MGFQVVKENEDKIVVVTPRTVHQRGKQVNSIQ